LKIYMPDGDVYCGTCGGVLRPSDPAPAGSYACECEDQKQMEREAQMILRGSATPDTLYTQIEAAYDAAEKAAQIEAEFDPVLDAANEAARAATEPVDAAYEACRADQGPGPLASPAQIASEPRSGLRRRVHVSISTKGQRVWDTTVEGTGYTEDEILAASDSLVREMEARYPAAGE